MTQLKEKRKAGTLLSLQEHLAQHTSRRLQLVSSAGAPGPRGALHLPSCAGSAGLGVQDPTPTVGKWFRESHMEDVTAPSREVMPK